MHLRYYIILLILFPAFYTISAQNVIWKTDLDYFLDNTEYAKSTLTRDQTMTGVNLLPQVGLKLDEKNEIFGGANLLKTAGSQNILDAVHAIGYYKYESSNSVFYAGIFPRKGLLTNYSDAFFQDSVKYYCPTLQGFYWKLNNAHSFIDIWLDWNGHQTAVNRETFFAGLSGQHKIKSFAVEFESYLFHFSKTRPSYNLESVCDNILTHLALTADLKKQTGLDSLKIGAGVLIGAERERLSSMNFHFPTGALFTVVAQYKKFGTDTKMYIGAPRMIYYQKYGNAMYWNNPFFRAGFYVENKWYYQFFNNQYVNGRANLNLQFSQGKMMYEQVLTLSANIDKMIGKL